MRGRILTAAVLSSLLSLGAYIPESNGYDTLSVQVIYAVPSDRTENAAYREAIGLAVTELLDWYVEQLDITSIAVIGELPQVCRLQQPTSYFATTNWPTKTWQSVRDDCTPINKYHRSIYVIYVDVPPVCERHNGGAVGHRGGLALLNEEHLSGLLKPPPHTAEYCPGSRGIRVSWSGILGHEIGHAFGLRHPPCEGEPDCGHHTIMGRGSLTYPDAYIEETDFARLHSVLQRGLPYFGPE